MGAQHRRYAIDALVDHLPQSLGEGSSEKECVIDVQRRPSRSEPHRYILMHERPSFGIAPVTTADDLASTIKLFRAYASALDVDLSYQNFEAEMEAMPGKYAPPAGELLLARCSNGTPVGCVGIRPIGPHGCCEMKRLYVAPEGRGYGLGKRLVEAIVKEAQRIGYRQMRLDTLPSMGEAIALYRKFGFELIEPYYETPVTGTIFMGRSLIGRSGQEPASHR